ncbi:MAG TPA: non-canonical purine NTP pyrophosphatase [Thermoleophilia bacterium]
MRLMLATGNRHKLGEFQKILAPLEVLPMPAWVELPPEDVESFADNARGKALGLARALAAGSPAAAGRDLFCLADDSGLEVEGLGWAPGVTSARYAGVDGPGADAANIERLLREMAGFGGPLARRARFVCSVVAIAGDMTEYAATGQWWGAIATAPRGEGGFGYDPVFVPEGSDLTVAEWPQADKDQASHRALAGRALLERLRREGLLDAHR